MPQDIRSFFKTGPAPKEGSKGSGKSRQDGGQDDTRRKLHSQEEPLDIKKQNTPTSTKKRRNTGATPFSGSPGKKRVKSGKSVKGKDKIDSDFELDLSGWDEDDSELEEATPAGEKNRSHEQKIKKEENEEVPAFSSPKTKTKNGLEIKSSQSNENKTMHTPPFKGPLVLIADNPEAMAAVDAVDTAAESLPPEKDLGMTLMSETSFIGRPPDEPVMHGQKEIPFGHPDCLTGKTFVISGVLESLTRGEAEDLIKRHGGKVTGNVSGRTSFLIVGQQTGRTKYHNAKEKGIKLINEEGLFHLIKATKPPEGHRNQASNYGPMKTEPSEIQMQDSTSQSTKQVHPNYEKKNDNVLPPKDSGMLWVEKWRPKSSKELVGNVQTVNTLRIWLQDWEKVHLHGGQPRDMPGNRGKDRSNEMKKKAVLLSGSPGIGKTSSALIVARELGYEPVEVNASDARGKADSSVLKGVGGKLANSIKELSTNSAVSYDISGRKRRLCLIMDEVDGMSSGDRGGVADLIKTIQSSRVPIICICNDKYSQKLRSLRNYCMELDFRKPTVQQISKRMMEIARAEGLSINQATMDALVQSANGGDIRLILGQLQMIRLRSTSLSYDEVRSGGHGTSKDLEMSPFEAAKRLLDVDGAALSMADQIELVFQDSDLVPLLVQENYLNHRPNIAPGEVHRLQVISKAAEGFSAGDVANRSVRQYQNWSLMPFAAAMGTVNPAAYMRGPREIFGLYPNEPNFPRFTAWLGQFSSGNKQRRLLGELHTRILSSGSTTADRTSLRLSYLPVLRMVLVQPLASAQGKENIPNVLSKMQDYCISRDDLDFIGDVCKFKTKSSWGEDPFKLVPTQTKSALTRSFNQQHFKPKTGFGLEDAKKKRKGRGSVVDEGEELLGEAADPGREPDGPRNAAAEDGEEEEDIDPMILRRKVMSLQRKGLNLTLKDENKKGSGKGTRGGKSGKPARGRGKSK